MPSKLSNMLASGRPVVSTAAPGTQVDEVVRRCGIVVPPGDVDAFAGAIGMLAENSSRRSELGRRGREYAESNWARDEILSRFEDDLFVLCDWRDSSSDSTCAPYPAISHKLLAILSYEQGNQRKTRRTHAKVSRTRRGARLVQAIMRGSPQSHC